MSGEARRSGPSQKGAHRRADIIRAVLAEVAARNVATLTLKQIAQRIGVSEANLLYHFGSKQELLLAVIAVHDDLDMAQLLEVDAAAVSAVVERHQQVPGLIELILNLTLAAAADPQHPAHGFIRARYARMHDRGVDRWTALMAEGPPEARGPESQGPEGMTGNPPGLPEGTDVQWLTRIMLAAADGLQLQWLLNPDLDMAADLRKLFELLLGAGPDTARS